jgi:hypothetical protein
MSYYTKNYLRKITQYDLKSISYTRLINEGKESKSFDIFLSHSYADKEFIKGLYIELTNKGHSVYVDWIIDPQFSRTNVTKDTVNKIRERMKQSKSLVYATSKNASTSKWMPWELGYMDGNKGKCAILPIMETESGTFNGQEFLSVYPIISRGEFEHSDLNVKVESYYTETMKQWI